MRLIEKKQDNKSYAVAIHTISKNKFINLLPENTKTINKIEIALNDFALQLRGEKLPFNNEIDILIQKAIDIGAEFLWIKKGKK